MARIASTSIIDENWMWDITHGAKRSVKHLGPRLHLVDSFGLRALKVVCGTELCSRARTGSFRQGQRKRGKSRERVTERPWLQVLPVLGSSILV